jgi:multidrug transporter EmrE-like cation transporter
VTAELVLLLLLWTVCEALGQLLFKHGMDRLEEGGDGFSLRVLGRALGSPVIWAGIIVHAAEFAIWLEILGQAPLSVAFPLESISYVTVVGASRLILREHVPPRRWAGIGLIVTGIVILGAVS